MYPAHDSHYDCVTAGYIHSLNTITTIGQESVDQNKLIINFQCQPQQDA